MIPASCILVWQATGNKSQVNCPEDKPHVGTDSRENLNLIRILRKA
jgi:hypothetical protein